MQIYINTKMTSSYLRGRSLWLFVQTSPALAIKGAGTVYDGLTIYTTHTHTHTAKTHVNMSVYKLMQAWSVNYIPIHMVYVYVGMRVIHFVICTLIYVNCIVTFGD